MLQFVCMWWKGTLHCESVSTERLSESSVQIRQAEQLLLVIAGLKSLLLEKRVEALADALELKDAQLGEVLAAAHLDPATLQQVSTSSW
jgi:hypothetical protein